MISSSPRLERQIIKSAKRITTNFSRTGGLGSSRGDFIINITSSTSASPLRTSSSLTLSRLILRRRQQTSAEIHRKSSLLYHNFSASKPRNMPQTRSQAHRRSMASSTRSREGKPTIAVIGSGWGGWTLTHELDSSKFDIVVLSKERTLALTPLLASAACGIFDFRHAEEPVRRRGQLIRKFQAVVEDVDFEASRLSCKSAINGVEEQEFDVEYDKLVIAPGCDVNTFGTKGVAENAYFMKSVHDATKLRARLLDVFEQASLPTLSDEERKDVLRVIVVGGGPTGVAIAAEIDDLVSEHLFSIYPHLKGLVSLDIYDVADSILTPFDEKLGEHAMESFHRRNVGIKTGKHIEEVGEDYMKVKEDGRVKFGILLWATGNKCVPFVEDMKDVKKAEKTDRILTDERLRVKRPDGSIIPDVFALGDSADIEGSELPTTAEVAVQKARWLAKCLNAGKDESEDCRAMGRFEYDQKALVAYVGGGDGVIAGKQDWTGASAYLAWRSGTLEWSRSWRRRFMIMMNWFMNYVDGREVARKN